jgi:hypothetical protein
LLWNRIRPTQPSHEDFSEIYRDYLSEEEYSRDHDRGPLLNLLRDLGFDITEREYPRPLHYSRDQWLELLFTHSSYLTLPAATAAELRGRLAERIGEAGVAVENAALAIVATPSVPNRAKFSAS